MGGCNAEIARHSQFGTTTKGITVHGGNHGHREITDRVECEFGVHRHAFGFGCGTQFGEFPQIAASGKGFFTCAPHDGCDQAVIARRIQKDTSERGNDGQAQRVMFLGPVDGDVENTIAPFGQNLR